MGIDSLISDAIGLAKEHPVATALGGAGVVVGAGLGTAAIVGATKRRKTKRRKVRNSRKRGRRIKHTKRGWKQDRKRKSKQPWEVSYRRRKRKHSKRMKSKRGIKYTKNGQPYKIMSNGRARFIKRRSKR